VNYRNVYLFIREEGRKLASLEKKLHINCMSNLICKRKRQNYFVEIGILPIFALQKNE
jgi:hypothetical protein